jgi:hypothetical protein
MDCLLATRSWRHVNVRFPPKAGTRLRSIACGSLLAGNLSKAPAALPRILGAELPQRPMGRAEVGADTGYGTEPTNP